MIGIDIEMPKACIDCPFHYRQLDAFVDVCQLQNDAITDVTKKEKGCPLIQLKIMGNNPHGFTADEWYRENFGENNGE